jgi:hypothetical protein
VFGNCHIWSGAAVVVALLSIATPSRAFDPEPYEEPAGGSFAFLLNPDDQVYGISGGSGTWLRGTPIFGDYFISLFSNEIENAVYSGVGMTIRIMPHWQIAPFIGGGGSYNYSFSHGSTTDSSVTTTVTTDEWPDRGDSYWAAHAEAGVRVWFSNRLQLFEIMVRKNSTSLEGDRDYWLVGISTGVGL